MVVGTRIPSVRLPALFWGHRLIGAASWDCGLSGCPYIDHIDYLIAFLGPAAAVARDVNVALGDKDVTFWKGLTLGDILRC